MTIHDLNNVPLAVGTSHVKWHLPSSTSAEHRGRTDKVLVHDHKAVYDHTKKLTVRLTADRYQMLEECGILFEVVQDYAQGTRSGRVALGTVKLNLAEYVDKAEAGDGGEEGITRRYLLRESKVNSTLRIGIVMKQVEGGSNFIAPPLKTATVFGGIAGIVAAEQGDTDTGDDNIPSITSKTRELAELQDVYRRTLAASWACRGGELPPDQLIEDLFAGGDGGAVRPPQTPVTRGGWHRREEAGSAGMSDADSRRTVTQSYLTPDVARGSQSPEMPTRGSHRRRGARSGSGYSFDGGGGDGVSLSSIESSDTAVVTGRSLEQQMQDSMVMRGPRRRDHGHLHLHDDNNHYMEYKEVSEFEVREDLSSWTISPREEGDDWVTDSSSSRRRRTTSLEGML